jgi:predicted small metal-binding protein
MMAKVIHCPCGTDVQGETDDELVAAVEQHVKENHPDKVGTMSREDILAGAHEH